MTTWVNFRDIRDRVSLKDVLFELYGLKNLTVQGSKATGPCPVHGGDSPRAFHADLERNLWHCFTRCRGGGNQLDMVAKRENISIRDAALKLQAFFLDGARPVEIRDRVEASAGQERAQAPPERDDYNPPLAVRLDLAHDHPHLLQERELTLATCEHFDVGYCRRGMLRGMIAIPIHDETGVLVAYAGRRLKPQDARTLGKYKLPTGFKKELVLFNFHRAKAFASERGLVLVEGFFGVLRLYEAGFPNAVATMGTELSTHQAELLASAREVTLLFDGDQAGRMGAAAVEQQLRGRTKVRLAVLPDQASPDNLPHRHLAWLIRGMQALDLAQVSFWSKQPTD